MLEELDDTELKSARRSRPAWPDASVGADTTARNGLRTSPFSFCVSKKKNQRAQETGAPEVSLKKKKQPRLLFC